MYMDQALTLPTGISWPSVTIKYNYYIPLFLLLCLAVKFIITTYTIMHNKMFWSSIMLIKIWPFVLEMAKKFFYAWLWHKDVQILMIWPYLHCFNASIEALNSKPNSEHAALVSGVWGCRAWEAPGAPYLGSLTFTTLY